MYFFVRALQFIYCLFQNKLNFVTFNFWYLLWRFFLFYFLDLVRGGLRNILGVQRTSNQANQALSDPPGVQDSGESFLT